jgi:hypothetical protein
MLLEEQIRSSAGDGPHLRALAKPILTGLVLLECSVLAVNRGRCPLSDLAQQFTADRGRQLRHLPAKLISRAQQGHFWRALHRWGTGRAWILAQEEVCRVISKQIPHLTQAVSGGSRGFRGQECQQLADADPRVEQREHLLGSAADLLTELRELFDGLFQQACVFLVKILGGVRPASSGVTIATVSLTREHWGTFNCERV